MIRWLLIFNSIFSFSLYADTESDLKKVMHRYLYSIKTADAKGVAEVVSEDFYKNLTKDGQLEKIFKMQKKDRKPIEFDLKFQKYFNKKNQYLVNIKDKSQKDYDHYWYVIILKEDKYKIDREEHLD